jgi:hypothetical protein
MLTCRFSKLHANRQSTYIENHNNGLAIRYNNDRAAILSFQNLMYGMASREMSRALINARYTSIAL